MTRSKQKPKAFCCECGDPIYANVDPSRDVVCAKCTNKKVNTLIVLEKKMKTDFKDTKDFNEKVGMFDVENKRKHHAGTQLRKIRKAKGFSQKIMALELGCSERHLKRMESGVLPLNKAVLKLFSLQG
ncbi:unnamed protein product [marine sediment metagenome]|uniref:Uncharacterized protein n=1 Tax=marine sediment metagenome TaxID=412755 RepID=X1FXN8_9ZZZZ